MSYTAVHPVGPMVLLVADAYTEVWSNFTEIGGTQGEVTYSIRPQKAYGFNDIVGNIPIAGRTIGTGAILEAQVPLNNHTAAKLAAIASEAVLSGGSGAVGWKPYASILTEKCFLLVPHDDYDADVPPWDIEYLLWIPKALAFIEGVPPKGLPTGNEDNQKPYNVRFEGLASSANIRIGRIWEHNLKAFGLQFIFDANDSQTV